MSTFTGPVPLRQGSGEALPGADSGRRVALARQDHLHVLGAELIPWAGHANYAAPRAA